MTDRERFEEWAKVWAENWADVPSLTKEQDGSYSDAVAFSAWAGWQASRKQALEEAQAKCLAVSDLHMKLVKKDAEHLMAALGAEQSMSRIKDLATPEGEQG